MRFLLSFVCLPALLVLAGCGTPAYRRLDAPVLQVVSVAPAEGTLTLRFVNANTVPMVVNRSTHTLHLDDVRLGRVDDPDPIGIPALGSASHVVRLPASLAGELGNRLAGAAGGALLHVETALQVAVPGDDTITLKTRGSGPVRP